MISIGFACTPKSQHLQFLYPTQDENYKLDMSELFDGADLIYVCTIGEGNTFRDRDVRRCNVSQDGIDMKNALEVEKYTINHDRLLKNINSVSGYFNYTSVIENYTNLTIYEVDYDNHIITELVSSRIKVNLDCKSFSSAFAQSNNIITDCYYNTDFQLILFSQGQQIVIYELFQSGFDINLIEYTDLVYSNNYIIYGIYLSNSDSYLHTYYYNETAQQAKFITRFNRNTFTDFSLMADGKSVAILNLTNCIYISLIDDLNQITALQPFNKISNNQQFLAIQAFPSQFYGQLTTSFYVVTDNYFDNIIEFHYDGQNLSVVQIYESYQQYTFNHAQRILIYLSTSFLVIFQNDIQSYFYIGKYSNSHEEQTVAPIYQNKDFEDYVQFYLNYEGNNFLKFSRKITWYHLQQPKLVININDQNQSGVIHIFAYENPELHYEFDIFGCNLTLTYQLLNQSNQDIYSTTNISKLSTVQDLSETFRLNDHFTGPLLQLSLIDDSQNDSNISISIPQSTAFQNLKTNLPGLFQNYSQLFFVENYKMLFYAWTEMNNSTNLYYTICRIGKNQILNCLLNKSINCDVSQLTTIQMTQSNPTELILAFDQGPQIIQVYSFQFSINLSNYSQGVNISEPSLYLYNIGYQQSINQFQILYNKLIVLNNQFEIIVVSYQTNAKYYINQTTIDQAEGQNYDIVFQPIQISINQQLYQSTLFINNQNGVITLELYNQPIQNTICFTILSYLKSNQDISQIFVSQMFMVLASSTNSPPYTVSFSVYDISDISHPKFSKPLPNCTIQPGTQILADNYFFYVRQLNGGVTIYSIDLPYHSSQYFYLPLSQNESISSTNTKQQSILSYKNNLWASFQNNPYSFKVYQVTQEYKMHTLANLSVSISNPWGNKSMNYDLIVVNTYLQISMNYSQFKNNSNIRNLTFYAKANSNNQVLIPLNMTNVSMGQVLVYHLLAYDKQVLQFNKSFNITNQFINESQYFTQEIVNITQMVSFCTSLFYQNTSGLYQSSYVIFDGLQLMNYNFTECLSLSVTINGPTIYMNSICKSGDVVTVYSLFPNCAFNNSTTCNSSQPWNYQKNTSIIYSPPFTSILKSSQLNQYLFILGKIGQNPNSQKIFIYNLNQNASSNSTPNSIQYKPSRTIQCRGGIIDYNFTVLQNKSLINNTYSGRGVIFYLCQNPSELKYVSFNITNTTLLFFSKVSNRVSDVITQYVNKSNSQFLQIFIYLVKYDQIILVLTSNNVYNLVIIMSYSPLSFAETSLQFEDVIAYIPPYGNYTQIPLGVLQNSYLALLFSPPIEQGGRNIIAMYNMEKINQTYNLANELSYNGTIQMDAGYQVDQKRNILQIALISQPYNKGQFLLMLTNDGENLNKTNVTLLVFNLSIYFNCTNVGDLSPSYEYYLVASNSFYSYNMTISITALQLSSSIWAWILLFLTILICGFLVSQFWTKIKMQNLENKSAELLEIEM
ncbi:unnamed protein product (macronuclear) [Paramecium tetraurelia]|uniref:Transmembrane protein n=1 Tax=Paramecium tetraurelia TaxID=5888 RepID=A0CCP7_PARTE|nr:uncharacterized protein GSPATT00037349001 [Paramecium tetraurelia]CAK68564.1 unnamed protein product [Paramecium tetraurelia]|eukprot:XP_001435961.1 hypothetical protein (macronuclear) [Paramecium tetraurelia strain d4-2]